MRQELSLAPSAWLAAAPIPIGSPASVLAAFVPGTAKVVHFRGPHRLYREAGWDSTRGKMATAYGSWWADELVLARIGNTLQQFESWPPKDLIQKAWPAQYRGMSSVRGLERHARDVHAGTASQ